MVALTAIACCFLSLALGALRSYSLARFEALLEGDSRRMQRLRDLLQREERLVIGIGALRGVLAVVGVSILTSLVLLGTVARHPEADGMRWLLTGVELLAVGAGLFVAFAQTVPFSIGERRAEAVLLRLHGSLVLLEKACLPLIWLFGGLATVALRVWGVAEVDEKEEVRHEILSAALAGENEGVIDEATKGVIENLMYFRDADVAEVMTPRIDIIAVDVKDDLDAILEVALKHEKSRLPVTDGSLDRIVGVLMVKDLLRALREPDITPASLVRKPYFVPETKRVADLLVELRARKFHMAIVADEYGGTAGLVTIEDLIEEIIGEIDDEHDKEDLPLRRISEGVIDVDAKLDIDAVNDEVGTKIPEDEDVETLGGFIALRLGRIPAKGDEVVLDGATFVVTEADERRATRVQIRLKRAVARSR